jgi:hypothetical protein
MVDLLHGRFDTAAHLREVAAEAAARAFIPDAENILHGMTAYPALMSGDRATCKAEAEAYEEFGRAEGAAVILAEGCWIWVGAGRPDRAEALLGCFAGDALDGLPRDVDWLLTVQCVLEAALAVGQRDVIATAAELLTPYEGRAVIDAGGVMFHGVTDDTLGRAHAVLGHGDVAARLCAHAVRTYERIGATWWRDRLAGWTAGEPVAFHPSPGGLWAVGRTTLPALRGLEYLHRLLTRPGADIGALELVGASAAGVTVEQGSTGEVADRQALAAYRKRLADIDALLERDGLGAGTVTRLAEERDLLRAHLRTATGLGDRVRRNGSSQERARIGVRKAIVGALARIAEADPGLGRHLNDRVSTGAVCRYEPDPSRPISWVLRPPEDLS